MSLKSPNTNYAFAQKDHWRRYVWNQLRDRVKVHPRDAVVIYLAGAQNLDREVAIKKGFHANNLIAVDSDKEVVTALRGSGQLAIHGDIHSVLFNWPSHTPASAVILDYCGGVSSPRVGGIVSFLLRRQSAGCIVAVNALRGRDDIAWVRSIAAKGAEKFRHRGEIFHGMTIRSLVEYAASQGLPEKDWDKWFYGSAAVSSPVLHSYKSGTQVFDSCVFKNPLPEEYLAAEEPDSPALSRQISAVLAHRTRRAA